MLRLMRVILGCDLPTQLLLKLLSGTYDDSLVDHFHHVSRGWHSNVFCTPIFILGQDEHQGTTTEKVAGQKSNCLLAGQESTLHFT